MRYSSRWKTALKNAGIPEEEHKAFLAAHQQFGEVLLSILRKDESSLQSEVYDKKYYDKPNWSCRQADFNGALRQLAKTIKLLED